MLLTQSLHNVMREQVRRRHNRPVLDEEPRAYVKVSSEQAPFTLHYGKLYYKDTSPRLRLSGAYISSSGFQERTGFVLFLSYDLLLPHYQFMLFMLFVYVIPISYYILFWRHSINKQSFTTVSLWRANSFWSSVIPHLLDIAFMVLSSLSYVIGWRTVETYTSFMGIYLIRMVRSVETKRMRGTNEKIRTDRKNSNTNC